MNLGFQLQNLFRRGSAPWAIKYFKEKLLTALTDDLLDKEETGIDDPVCKDIKRAISSSISKIEYLKDGGYFYKHLHENLSEFLFIYSKWNNGGVPEKRYYFLTKLRERKSSIFSAFYDKVNSLEKQGKQAARYQEYLTVLNSEKARNADINRSFQDLVTKYPGVFPKLEEALDIFNRRIDGI